MFCKKWCLLLGLPLFVFGGALDVISHFEQPSPPFPSSSERIGTPPACPLPNNSIDFKVHADFLWWYANVTNLSYATVQERKSFISGVEPNAGFLNANNNLEFDRKWNPAFRLGIGTCGFTDGWDLLLQWTYYHSKQKVSKSLPPNTVDIDQAPIGTRVFTSLWFESDNIYSTIKGGLQLQLNQIDLSLGRRFALSPKLYTRPFIGLRGIGTSQRFYLNGQGTQPNQFYNDISYISIKQSLFSIGLLTGAHLRWTFFQNFSLIGNAGCSLTYGKHRTQSTYTDFATNQTTNETQFDYTRKIKHRYLDLQTMIDLGLGINWHTLLRDDRIRLSFSALWETHLLVDYHKIMTIFHPMDEDLALSGIVLRGRIDF